MNRIWLVSVAILVLSAGCARQRPAEGAPPAAQMPDNHDVYLVTAMAKELERLGPDESDKAEKRKAALRAAIQAKAADCEKQALSPEDRESLRKALPR